jgi:hypothetical protein
MERIVLFFAIIGIISFWTFKIVTILITLQIALRVIKADTPQQVFFVLHRNKKFVRCFHCTIFCFIIGFALSFGMKGFILTLPENTFVIVASCVEVIGTIAGLETRKLIRSIIPLE